MIFSRRASVNILDLYFDEPARLGMKPDIIRYNQWSMPVGGAECRPFSTIVLDLTRSHQELLSTIRSHTRRKLRRAEKDDLVCECSNGENLDTVRMVADHFDRCGQLKNLVKASRARLLILARSGALDVSFVRDGGGEILSAISYLRVPGRARALYAAAAFRNTKDLARRAAIGCANRYLVWQDILRFKKAGLRMFDFGGYYTGSEDQEKLRINTFKEEFGGVVLHQYNCQEAATLTGVAALWAIELRNRWQLHRRAVMAVTSAEQKNHESSVPASQPLSLVRESLERITNIRSHRIAGLTPK
jgi:hypothetical protein